MSATPAVVALVIDKYSVVINKGTDSGFKVGHRVVIFTLGDEVLDPETQKSLGRLEIVRGTGKVEHVQTTMATVKTDMRKNTKRVYRTRPNLTIFGLGSTGETVEEFEPEETPFDNVQVGDLVRRIS